MKRPRFEVLKLKIPRGPQGSSAAVVQRLNKLRSDQSLVYLKHNTLVGNTAYWTAIVENGGRSELDPKAFRQWLKEHGMEDLLR